MIYVDGSSSAPLRQYLYTMMEGADPHRGRWGHTHSHNSSNYQQTSQTLLIPVRARRGRLKFTVVSEPMDDDEECVDVGHAFLDLKELLLTGNDVIEQEIDSRCS